VAVVVVVMTVRQGVCHACHSSSRTTVPFHTGLRASKVVTLSREIEPVKQGLLPCACCACC
jgi:hypothetical protein